MAQSPYEPTKIKPSKERKTTRAKSCPKNWMSNYFDGAQSTEDQSNCDRRSLSNDNLSEIETVTTLPQKSQSRNGKKSSKKCKKYKTVVCHRKPSRSADFTSNVQMVRTNLAANLRCEHTRKKLFEMSCREIKDEEVPLKITKVIPKCHRWNVKKSLAWKSFNLEDTTTEHLIRQTARREEQKLRQQAHYLNMTLMRERVKSAQLLLEGRALSAK